MAQLPKDDNIVAAAPLTGEHRFDVPGFQAVFQCTSNVYVCQ